MVGEVSEAVAELLINGGKQIAREIAFTQPVGGEREIGQGGWGGFLSAEGVNSHRNWVTELGVGHSGEM